MKNKLLLFIFILTQTFCFGQYLVVGKDSVSLAEFKTNNAASLKNFGVAKTLKSVEDFYLLQQFAEEKRADTTAYFKQAMAEKEQDLHSKYFYSNTLIQPILAQFVNDNQTEIKVLFFVKEVSPDDKTDYNAVYQKVVSGKMTMDQAISEYIKSRAKAFYIKPGSLDYNLYTELKTLPKNGFTPLKNTGNTVSFAQVLDRRPSLGYVIFGTISYANDENAGQTKEQIFTALKEGKKFVDVAKMYGSTDAEKNNGGLVMGSPTLPDEVYAALKNKKEGEYTEPILVGDKYFIFNIYALTPYEITDKTQNFYKNELLNSSYAQLVQQKLIESLKKSAAYKEFPLYQTILKSYASLTSEKNQAGILYRYGIHSMTVGALKELLLQKIKDADKLNPTQWKDLLNIINSQFVYNSYSQDFFKSKEVKPLLDAERRNLFSQYIFSVWLKDEIKNHPELLADYYNSHKDKFMWERRANGRVAIISEPNLVSKIKNLIENPKNWDNLQKKFAETKSAVGGKAVSFEGGEMSETADVFTKYKVPFQPGVFTTEMGGKTLVIAIDHILPSSQMTLEEAVDYVKDSVSEAQLNKLLEAQRSKIKISIDPEFKADLEKNFKK